MTPDQRRFNLLRANQVRSERAVLKERMARREVLLDDILQAPPECALTATVFDVIRWAPFFGETKARAALRRLGEPEHRLLGHMTRRRRLALIQIIGRHNPKALWGAAHRDYIC